LKPSNAKLGLQLKTFTKRMMELVSNPVGGVVAGAVALDGVALDVSDEHRLPPAYAGRRCRSACDLLLYNPLAWLLGYALAVALVVPVGLLDAVYRLH
jgi:hypothetical protein